MPKISIILASYNRANMVSESIKSCLNQTYHDFELIVVDDCSSDNSVEIITEFCDHDPRVRLIQNKINKRLPATLNTGFNEAKGHYYSWISDDNIFLPDALETMVNYLEQNPGTGAVYTDYTTIDKDGKNIARIYQEPPEFLPIRFCIGPSFLYRSSVAKKVGPYNEALFLIEDYEFFLKMGLCTKIHHIPKSYYLYRVHSGALTQSRKEEIKVAKRKLKEQFSNKYDIPNHLQPINNLYMWFIRDKTFASCFDFMLIILKNPIITIYYIIKNVRRLF